MMKQWNLRMSFQVWGILGMMLFGLYGTARANRVDGDTTVTVKAIPQPTDDQYRVITNRFWDNWFVFGNVGGHAYFGDYAGRGKFSGRLSPDLFVGAGKWFSPGIGAKIQFGGFRSRSYSEEKTPYVYGEQLTASDGTPYWKAKIKWWDLSIHAMFNLSRLICGYEGIGSDKLMNQFILSAGIGAVHHWDIGPQANEFSGHLELQYSRFLTKSKALSLDLKAHGIFYQTNFDFIAHHKKSNWWDSNLGFSVGLTYHFKQRGWERCVPSVYVLTETVAPAPVIVEKKCAEYKTFTFYIFYPNNYSGRNDAPIVKDAPVNSIDYLAAGIFTQKRFEDGLSVEERLSSRRPLSVLRVIDVPTEKATGCEKSATMIRGYEMSDFPLSLSMEEDSLRTFQKRNGYYYAPIYDGVRTWYYRIDDATKGQSLLSGDNYRDTKSYGLNAHSGLALVRERLAISNDTDLYSFADVYAALEGNEGYISQYADSAAVAELRKILEKGTILNVQAEGLATSQDNYIGEDAVNVALNRNKTLSYNRAYSVIRWLQSCQGFQTVRENDYVINALANPIGTVNDKSIQSLDAKLNRCVKVQVQYMIIP